MTTFFVHVKILTHYQKYKIYVRLNCAYFAFTDAIVPLCAVVFDLALKLHRNLHTTTQKPDS